MSQENVELAHDALAAYRRGGIDAVLEYFDPSVELVSPPQWPEDRAFWGHAGLREIQAGFDEQFDEMHIDLEKIIDLAENGVLLLYNNRIGIKGSDRELAQPTALRLEIRAGKITRWDAYLSWAEALKAVGLEE